MQKPEAKTAQDIVESKAVTADSCREEDDKTSWRNGWSHGLTVKRGTLPKTNMAMENHHFKQEIHLPIGCFAIVMLILGGVTLCSCQATESLLDSNGTCRDKKILEPCFWSGKSPSQTDLKQSLATCCISRLVNSTSCRRHRQLQSGFTEEVKTFLVVLVEFLHEALGKDPFFDQPAFHGMGVGGFFVDEHLEFYQLRRSRSVIIPV